MDPLSFFVGLLIGAIGIVVCGALLMRWLYKSSWSGLT